jgi:hypothetical protein
LNLFIAYGDGSDQTTALRLQALGVVNGHNVFVPPAYTRAAASLDPRSEQTLRVADIVLGLVTSVMSESCRQELNFAKALGRRIVVLAEPMSAAQLEPYFPGSILEIDPANPAQAERGIVEFFGRIEMEQTARKTLVGLGTIALGLLLVFTPQDR